MARVFGTFWVLCAALQAFGLGRGLAGRVVLEAFSAGFAGAAAIACLVAASSGNPRHALGWRLTAVACGAWTLAQIGWTIALTVGKTLPIESLADLGFLPFDGVAALAFITLVGSAQGPFARLRTLLDGALLTVSLVLVSWVLVVSDAIDRGVDEVSAMERLTVILSPVADIGLLVVATIAIVRVRRSGKPLPSSLGLVWLAVAGLALCDLLIAAQIAFGVDDSTRLYGYLWPLTLVLVALAALRDDVDHDAALPDRSVPEPVAQFVPHGAMLIALCATLMKGEAAENHIAVIGWAILITLLIARQVVAVYETRKLTEGLERRIDQRVRELDLSQQRFESLVQNSSDVVVVVSRELNVLYVSDNVERAFGYAPSDVLGEGGARMLQSAGGRELREAVEEAMSGGAARRVVTVDVHHTDGTARRVQVTLTNMFDREAVQGLVLNMRDVTAQHKLEQRLTHEALHDSLTGLSNRGLLLARLTAALDRRDPRGTAIVFVDINDFKRINDTLGHMTGDLLLEAIALRLQTCVRETETVARLGGDEFAILVERTDRELTPLVVAERVAAVLRRPIPLEGREIQLEAGIGVALAEAGDDAGRLLQFAHLAMHRAKGSPHEEFVVYDPSMHAAYVARVQMEEDLRATLADQSLQVHYQPIFDLRDGRMRALEALVRWEHPQRGFISPAQFVPVAESAGIVDQIGRFVIAESLRQLARWRSTPEGRDLYVSVNISAAEMRAGDALVAYVARELSTSGVPAEALVIEITESMLVEHTEDNIQVLNRLKALGVRIAIDDFGTGYSSLSYLHRLPADILKVDRSFIERLGQGARESEFVHTILLLGRNLGMATLAEGVEHHDQWHLLTEIGCRLAQGRVFSMPVDAAEVDDRLACWTAVGPSQSRLTQPV